jgi:hypothetical protein
MAIGSGLSAQAGIVTEVTPGTPVAVTRFVEFDSESMSLKRHIAQGSGLRGGAFYQRGARRTLVAREAAGDLAFDIPTNGFGLFLQHMLGSFSTVATVKNVTAYQQIHNPGSTQGKTFTLQVGNPDTTGVVNPFTYPGCKITDWELTAAQHKQVSLKLSIDAMDEMVTTSGATALQSAVYGASTGMFTFKDAAVLSGGTVSNVSGILTATGTAVASVRNISIKSSTPYKNDRFFAGSATKAENLENDFRATTGQVDLEFSTLANYNQYLTDASTVLQVNFIGALIAGSTAPVQLSFFFPLVKFEDGISPDISGPDVLMTNVGFTALDDGTNGALQVVYVSSDVAV